MGGFLNKVSPAAMVLGVGEKKKAPVIDTAAQDKQMLAYQESKKEIDPLNRKLLTGRSSLLG